MRGGFGWYYGDDTSSDALLSQAVTDATAVGITAIAPSQASSILSSIAPGLNASGQSTVVVKPASSPLPLLLIIGGIILLVALSSKKVG